MHARIVTIPCLTRPHGKAQPALSQQSASGEDWQHSRNEPGYAPRERAGLSHLAQLAAEATTGSLPIVTAPTGPVTGPQAAHSHRKLSTGVISTLMEHRTRFAAFSVVGAAIFVLGIALQALLTGWLHMNADLSFLLQGVVSVEASFIANYYWTWRDQDVAFWPACGKFNAQKVAASVANLVLYAGLVKFGMNYLLSNVVTTAVFTVVNYVMSNVWVFTSRTDAAAPLVHVPAQAAAACDFATTVEVLPTVSVIIPCRNNAATIRATVDSLLGQDYPALEEVILVGSTGDSTWSPLADVRDPRLVMLEQENTPGKRDPNVKRDKGIRKASGEVLALADSDIVMDPDWLSRAIPRLLAQGGGVVAGGMKRIHDTFWGRFVDRNVLAAKTPRVRRSYSVTAQNFGHYRTRPPITANAVFTRDVYESCPLDVAWAYGYEDYEWFWRVAKARHKLWFAGDISGAHHHRRRFRDLITEYRRSAEGCSHFIRRHPDSPLAVKRRRQAIGLPLAALAGLSCAAALVAAGLSLPLGAAVVVAAGALMAREVASARRLEAAVYPYAGAALGVVFTWTLASKLAWGTTERVAAPVWESDRPTTPSQPGDLRRHGSRLLWYVLIGSALLASFLRLWQLASKPNWQVDEVTYFAISRNLELHHLLALPSPYGTSWTPFLWHPPFYFLLLSRWFTLAGAGIYQARLLGVTCALLTLALIVWLVHRLAGARAALVCAPLLATDGWLVYVERCSYIENILMLIAVGALLVYERALHSDGMHLYIVAGTLAGLSSVFKHTGTFILLTIFLHFVTTRRTHWRSYAVLGACAGAVIATYAVSMSWFWGHLYVGETVRQAERVLGIASSEGSLTSPLDFLKLMVHQYVIFLPSVVMAVAGMGLAAKDLWTTSRRRTALAGDPLIVSWLAAAVIMFGASNIRYPQYFELALIPAYLYLWMRVGSRWRGGALVAAAVVAMAAGVVSFSLRGLSDGGNPFQEAAQYMTAHVPHSALVSAESPLGYDIPQRYCAPYEQSPPLAACVANTRYVISWITDLQTANPRHYSGVSELLRHSQVIAEFSNFQGTIYIREVVR